MIKSLIGAIFGSFVGTLLGDYFLHSLPARLIIVIGLGYVGYRIGNHFET